MKLSEVSQEEQDRNLVEIRKRLNLKTAIVDGVECSSIDDSRHSCQQCYDCKLYEAHDIRKPVNRSCPKFKHISDEIWTGEETCPYFTSID